MDPTTALHTQLDDTIRLGTQTLAKPSAIELEALEQKIQNLRSLSRETFQEVFRDRYSEIAARLEAGEGLQAGDREAIELLFTGEEAASLSADSGYSYGVQELRRILEELQRVQGAETTDVSSLLRIQGLCQSATQVLPGVLFHVRERERIQRLRENLNGDLRGESGRLVARMIRDLLTSPHR